MAKTTKYRIGNPKRIPEGIRILAYGDKDWFEGDEFVQPAGFTDVNVARRIREGFIVEVKG